MTKENKKKREDLETGKMLRPKPWPAPDKKEEKEED